MTPNGSCYGLLETDQQYLFDLKSSNIHIFRIPKHHSNLFEENYNENIYSFCIDIVACQAACDSWYFCFNSAQAPPPNVTCPF